MSSVKLLKEQILAIEIKCNEDILLIQQKLEKLIPSDDTNEPISLCEIIAESVSKAVKEANSLFYTDIKNDINEVRNVILNNLVLENRRLRGRLSLLETRIISNERASNIAAQHSRKVNLEIDGIPDTVNQENLKKTVIGIFSLAGVDNQHENDIEVIHRLNAKKIPKPVIFKARRDFLDRVLKMKKDIQKLNPEMTGFEPGTKFFINNNLCPAFSKIAFNCLKLKKSKEIADTWYNNTSIKIKTNEGLVKEITHEVDLVNLFPEYEHFTFDTRFYINVKSEDLDIERYDDRDGW